MREIERSVLLPAPPEAVFAALHTPSAIRHWWGAARAIVNPVAGGLWVAAWGDDEDAPEYITAATLRVFEPPRRLVMAEFRYFARDGALPFACDLPTEFSVDPQGEGSLLRVLQTGFPDETAADEFYAACQSGWDDTLKGMERFWLGG